jgi:hypothetical protein
VLDQEIACYDAKLQAKSAASRKATPEALFHSNAPNLSRGSLGDDGGHAQFEGYRGESQSRDGFKFVNLDAAGVVVFSPFASRPTPERFLHEASTPSPPLRSGPPSRGSLGIVPQRLSIIC